MAGEVERLKSLIIKYKYMIFLTIGSILTLIGVILMFISRDSIDQMEKVVDYTNCRMFDEEGEKNLMCRQYLKESNDVCTCSVDVNISEPLLGEVLLYYELSTYNQTVEKYENSRDKDQLKGVFSPTPSGDCEPYRYDDFTSKPIVPCGAIADSMFNDSYTLKMIGESLNTQVPLIQYGILSVEDKIGFQNPENLKQGLQNYSKPMSWSKPIYELDLKNSDNNGFQNENFIAWMRTDWKRKPHARVNHTVPEFRDGLPAASYVLIVEYNKSPATYEGERKIILVSKIMKKALGPHPVGLLLLTLGILCLASGAVPYVNDYFKAKKNRAVETEAGQNVNPATNPQQASEEQNESPLLNKP